MTLIHAREDATLPRCMVRTTSADDRLAVMSAAGELDLAAGSVLRSEFDRHLEAGRGTIRVDARHVTFFDCHALGQFVEAGQRCRAASGTLVITAASRPVRRLLALTRLDQDLLEDFIR